LYHYAKEVVQLLLNQGAEVNAQGGEYGNALQAASRSGHKEMVQLLLNQGADVDAQGGKDGNARNVGGGLIIYGVLFH
jgi:ankyrin repeat protein